MALFMAAMAVGSLLSANSARNSQMKAQAADVKLQRARLQSARTRGKDTLSTNTSRMRKATQKREIAIESNRVQAESKFDETFAGSGISGASVNELDREINSSVEKNKYENIQALDDQLSDANKSYGDQLEDINSQSKGINTTAPRQDVLGDLTNAASTAASFGSAVGGLSKSKSKFAQGLSSFLSL